MVALEKVNFPPAGKKMNVHATIFKEASSLRCIVINWRKNKNLHCEGIFQERAKDYLRDYSFKSCDIHSDRCLIFINHCCKGYYRKDIGPLKGAKVTAYFFHG